jgi:hypothetical protein
MRHLVRLLVITLASSCVLLLPGCSTYGGGYDSGDYGVYGGYGYPYYDNGGYYYDGDNDHNDNRPDRPDRPLRPTHLPARIPGGGMSRPMGGMGRPAGGMARGGGGRGR